jgi:hypothetical protein
MSDNNVVRVTQAWLRDESTGEEIELVAAGEDDEDTMTVTWHPDGFITLDEDA